MPTTEQELDNFARYARQRLDEGDVDLTLDELFDLWRSENPSNDAYAENVAAIAVAIEDFKNGDRGAPAGQLSQQLRDQSGSVNG